MPKSVEYSGPFTGIEERETAQTETSAAISINVDYSRGYLECRKGFTGKAWARLGRSQLHSLRVGKADTFLLAVGPEDTLKQIAFTAFDQNGNALGAAQTVTNDLGEPYREDWQCSFVNTILSVDADGDGVKDSPHKVTLIVTPFSTYVYDPIESVSTIRKVDLSKDAFQENDLNVSYWQTTPVGTVAVEHRGRVFYAGIQDATHVDLSSPLDLLQDVIPEAMLDQTTRGWYKLQSNHFYWSDILDPLGIQAKHVMGIDENERITGMRSWQDQLVIFSDRSIYVLTGSGDETWALFRTVVGVGCVSHRSIVDVGDMLLFASHDGIYAFAGQGPRGGVAKISKSVDSLWSGGHQIHTGFSANSTAGSLVQILMRMGWPFKARRASMSHTEGLHVQSLNQVWWSFDCENSVNKSYSVTLVYDYAHKAWSYYLPSQATNASASSVMSLAAGTGTSVMYSGTTVFNGTEEKVVTTSAHAELWIYGGDVDSIGGMPSPARRTIPMAWVSGRLMRGNDQIVVGRPIRLKMLATGNGDDFTEMNHVKAGFEGEEAASDSSTSASSRQYTEMRIPLYPDEDLIHFWKYAGLTYGNWGNLNWQERGWFSCKLEPGSVKSRTFRLSLMDHNFSAARPSALAVQSFSIEYDGGGGDTR